jgi:4-amino-4-deoxy-L-arabinose transferase-like glycosyltransferase
LAYRAWILQKGWTWFWIAAAAVTLTKGPLGIMIAAGGLLACFWERKEGNRLPFGGAQLPGIVLFLSITLTWFFLAYLSCGKPFIDTMLPRELVGHAVGGYKGKIPLIGFYKPSFYFLTRFFPWSILSILGFWRIWQRPSPDPHRRAAERFVFCCFFFGLAVFSLASHHRGDLIFPLLPAASLVAGNVAAQRFHFPTARSFFLPAASFVVIAIIATGAYYYRFRSHDPHIRATCRLRDAAGQIDAILKPGTRIEYVGTDYTLQFYLNTLQPLITAGEAVKLMAMPGQIYIVMRPTCHDAIKASLTDVPVYVLFQSEDIVVISNRPPSQI